jgi:RNA-binding protein 23/39
MFDPEVLVFFYFLIKILNFKKREKEKDIDWGQKIEDEVFNECNKFGKVEHVFVNEESKDGIVYIRFDSENSAFKAKQALNRRWYAKKLINCEYVKENDYLKKFPELLVEKQQMKK